MFFNMWRTVINWFPGKNILKAPNVREVERSDYEETSDDDDEDSFFQFFNPPEVPTDISELDDHKVTLLFIQLPIDGLINWITLIDI